MKVKSYLLAGLSIMMLASCSNDDLTGDAQKPGGENFEGEGIMTLSLKFAGNEGDALTRAWGDPADPGDNDFEDGVGAESEIKDVTVYYFSSEDGNAFLGNASATFDKVSGDGSNTESKISAVVPANVVKGLMEDENASANIIVVVNAHNLPTLTITDTYATFNTALENVNDNAGFMMTSVNYAPEKEGSRTPTYFTPITKANVAKKGDVPPTKVEVYVERVCGKVTLSANASYNNTTNGGAFVTVKNWGLNVRNKKVYPVKVIGDSWKDLTVAKWPGADNWTNEKAEARHRSYWAEDPNYNSYDDDGFNVINFSDLTAKTTDAQYCLENTFDNNNQMRNQTTTAVVYAQYQPTGITGTWVMSNNVYYSMDTYVGYFLWSQNVYKKVQEGENIKWVTAKAEDLTYASTGDVKDSKNNVIGATGWAFSQKGSNELYIYKGTSTAKEQGEIEAREDDFTAVDYSTLTTAFATYSANASIYVNGYCYYEIYIRHFNNDEVPLAKEPDVINSQTQLGRYGIVRNHSYKLNIQSIKNPGKPIEGNEITPEIGPDDPGEEYYMDVTINVLRWAVRTQEVEL